MSDKEKVITAGEDTEFPNTRHARFILMSDVTARTTEWLWYPYIALGKVTIMMGDPGEGKSTLALNLAAAVSRGWKFPSKEKTVQPEFVIYQNAEDGLEDTIRPRLDSAGADPEMVVCVNEEKEPTAIGDDRLERLIFMTKAKLVILDPLQAYLGADVDMHRANEIRPLMAHLASLAEENHCAIVLIGHMNKRRHEVHLPRCRQH
ncbi:MAG: AAA family ATPase [Oscillospiraceae bacterium]|nr:AAA family ATPase [Oscillospiraceae bacterium]